MRTPTEAQERFFDNLRNRLPSGTDFEVHELSGQSLQICFFFKDPRPSQNGLVDSTLSGSVIVGPRGGTKFANVYRWEPFAGQGYDSNRSSARAFLRAVSFEVSLAKHGYFA